MRWRPPPPRQRRAARGSRHPAGPAPDPSGAQLPPLSAPHVPSGAIRVDGHLDDAAWKTAGDTEGFVHPGTGQPEARSHVKGAARVAWDDQHLYLGFVIGDGDPVT